MREEEKMFLSIRWMEMRVMMKKKIFAVVDGLLYTNLFASGLDLLSPHQQLAVSSRVAFFRSSS